VSSDQKKLRQSLRQKLQTQTGVPLTGLDPALQNPRAIHDALRKKRDEHVSKWNPELADGEDE
jgi:hypothetical protein